MSLKTDLQTKIPSGKNAGKTYLENFMSSFDKKKNGCWEWNRKRFPNNYGMFRVKKKDHLAHRVMFEFSTGISNAPVVRHRCDNPCCVNPKHLLGGTASDNVRDMYERGRANNPVGERSSQAKLSESDVLQIRKLRWEKGETTKAIAKKFGVSQKQISVVSRGIQWGHL